MSRRKRQNVRKQRRMLVYFVAVVLVVLSWVHLSSKQTLVLHAQRYVTTYDTQTYLIKNEQVFYFDSMPALLKSEGLRVSMQAVLFENEGSLRQYCIAQWSLLQGYYSIPAREDIVDDLIAEKERYETLSSQEEISQSIETMEKLVSLLSYAGFDEEGLETLKAEAEELAAAPYEGKTLLKLGGEFPGYLFYEADGYESLLTPYNMEALVGVDREDLEEVASVLKESSGVIKVINDDTAYMMVTVPEGLLPDLEERLEAKKSGIDEKLEADGSESYLDYLNRRIDVLRTMPTVSFTSQDMEYTAKLVDVQISQDGEHVWILQLKDGLTGDLLQQREVEIQLVTYDEEGYVVPEKSLVIKDEKTYIVVLTKGYLRKNLEVTVTKTDGDQVFLSREDNEAITEGMQLMVNP